MTPLERLRELRRLLDAATAGEWTARDCDYGDEWWFGGYVDDDGGGQVKIESDGSPLFVFGGDGKQGQVKRNAALIVALRNSADALLTVVEAAERVCENFIQCDGRVYAIEIDKVHALEAAIANLNAGGRGTMTNGKHSCPVSTSPCAAGCSCPCAGCTCARYRAALETIRDSCASIEGATDVAREALDILNNGDRQ